MLTFSKYLRNPLTRVRKRRLHYGFWDIVHGWIIIASGAAGIFLVICAGVVFVEGVFFDRDKPETKAAELNPAVTYVVVDSISTTEAINSLSARLESIERTQETLASDLRQETNNIINKVNGWIGFWIAILAIFGAIIPMVIQHTLRKKSQREVQDMLENAMHTAATAQLLTVVSDMQIQRDCSLLRNHPKMHLFQNREMHEAHCAIDYIVRNMEDNEGDLNMQEENRLIHALVQYFQLLDLLILSTQDRKEIRRLQSIKDDITNLIIATLDHSGTPRRQVWATLLDLLPQLRTLYPHG